MTDKPCRLELRISGIVQGVGFRPHVYRLAKELSLTGWVLNDSSGVSIAIQGDEDSCRQFAERLQSAPPPLAKIEHFSSKTADAVQDENDFVIRHSVDNRSADTLISPDIATCANCERELADENDRRYAHPFINCTDCGPRYSIIKHIPYDRPSTTMAKFEMCPKCQKEYENPADRRFHAQPVCCPECGPHLQWFDKDTTSDNTLDKKHDAELIERAVKLVSEGKVLAIKGLGGYHLACDAMSDEAVARLRSKKHREEKPLAIMFRDLESLQSAVVANEDEIALLTSAAAPIVLCRKMPGNRIAESVAPGNQRLGVFLPYTPLHKLLFAHPGSPEAWVMTSGNISDEPTAFEDSDAIARLAEIADAILYHNRPIHLRTDDSVMRCVKGRARFLRRSRGFVPMPVKLPVVSSHSVMASGADLKNAVCITRGEYAFLGHHIGDLANTPALEGFRKAIKHTAEILEVKPDIAACDMHPEYFSSRFIREESKLPFEEIQHHHAHATALLAEHGLNKPILAWICDGTGYGPDGTIWGCELLLADLRGFVRLATLKPAKLPGGDSSIREPWKQAAARLAETADFEFIKQWAIKNAIIPDLVSENGLKLFIDQSKKQGGIPLSSGLGRLFDSVAGILGIRTVNIFEGQAPMALEDAANTASTIHPIEHIAATHNANVLIRDHAEGLAGFEPKIKNIPLVELDPGFMLKNLADLRLNGTDEAGLALAFHKEIADTLAAIALHASEALGIDTVGLSGGCFLNEILETRITAWLADSGKETLVHHLVPPGDGCIALGQAACLHARRKEK